MKFVALDFETANEQRDSACAVGIAIVEDGRVVQTRYHLIRPRELRFSPWNVRIHGITPEHVKDAPTLTELWPAIAPVLEHQVVVAHNAPFDISVLRHSLYANALPIPELQYLCSARLARMAWPELTSHSLHFLAACHNIELDHHNAESDAKAASAIVLTIAHERAANCLSDLADCLGVTVGEVFPDGTWMPSSAPSFCRGAQTLELTIPDNYNIRSHPLYRKNVVFTGTLQFFTRSQAFQIVKLFGGTPRTAISKKIDMLVTGVQDIKALATGRTESSKLRQAREMRMNGCPIEIITDHEFQQCVFQVTGDDVMPVPQTQDNA